MTVNHGDMDIMRRFLSLSLGLTALTLAAAASAQDEPSNPPTPAPAAPAGQRQMKIGLMAGAKVGGAVNFSGISPFVIGGIEVGYALPFLNRSFAIAIDLDYTVPRTSGAENDPRVAGGKYTWYMTQKQLALTPMVMYRMTFLGRVVPYIGVGPRIWFIENTVSSNEGNPVFQPTTERSTKVGVGIPAGAEIHLGPGGLLAELMFQYGVLDHTQTGATNTGAVSLQVGYRFLL